MNSHENQDLAQRYTLPLDGEVLKTLSGTIAPHSYLIGKVTNRGRQLWLQANTEYPERDTVSTITCRRRPDCRIEPPSAARQADWDEAAHTFRIRLSHRQGSVEVHLK